MTTPSILARSMSEATLQANVIDLARLRGWHVAHFRPALTRRGYRTPVEADAAGFPDLVLVREYVLFAELKSETGRTRPEQLAWRQWLAEAHYHVRLWRPSDWLSGEIERTLALVDP